MSDTESEVISGCVTIRCYVDGPYWVNVTISNQEVTVMDQIDKEYPFARWRSLSICSAPPLKPVLLYDHTNAARKEDVEWDVEDKVLLICCDERPKETLHLQLLDDE